MKRMTQSGLGFWKIGVTIVLAILFLAVATAIASAATIYVPDDYPTIQAAVDNATAGDTITVRDGTYTENVRVNKQLTIRSENGPANCIVDAGGNGSAITLGVDGITLEGFSAINSGSSFTDAGIKVISSSNKITGNTVSSNKGSGIYLRGSRNNTISGNNVSGNGYGIYLEYTCSNNIISGNNVSGNNKFGIYLYPHVFFEYSSSNTISGNNVSGNNWSGIYLRYSRNNTISGNNVINNDGGIYLWRSRSNTISGNDVINNDGGISLFQTSSNTISGNDVINNDGGIYLGDPCYDSIYLNNFVDNTFNAEYSEGYESTSIWNSPSELTYTYSGGQYTNYLGNYWDDYTGSDANNDGIGDTPYPIKYDNDNYPLVLPWESYFAQNGKIKGIDVSHHQGNIDWSSVYNSGKKFAFAKAAEGVGFTDSNFDKNMNNGYNAGMLMGAYHFARPDLGNDAADEARYFVSVAGTYLKAGYLRPALDLEKGASLGKEALSNWVHEWMNTVIDETGIQPILYVTSSYANNYLDNSITQYNLWIAHWTYNPSTYPNTGIWGSWDFWQYSDVGSVPGISGNVDLDIFNGDMTRLYTFVITKPSGKQVETATGTGIAYFTSDAGTIVDLASVDESDLPLEGKPDVVFPHGFFSFNITGLAEGQTVVVTIMLPSNMPVGTQYWKYHASEGGWIQIPMGSDDGDNVITITLVDGGLGDDDGIANGEIVDQGGPGVRATKPTITKSGSTSVAPGGTITYTIEYSNAGVVDLTNVTITENYPKGMTFISADPAPDAGTNNKWTIGTLSAGASGKIIIKVKVPESMDLAFTESGSVTGEGFVMIDKDLSTEQKPYSLKNVVTISCTELSPVSASAFTTVSGVPGTSLELTEHGSGIYSSDEILNLQTKNKSIMLQKSTEAEYQPTSFNFSDGFAVNFATKWTQDICARNMVMGDAMHKKIKDASYIKDETITEVGKYRTSMEFESSFYGAAHIGTVSKSAKTSEDYIGAFEITWAGREECRYLFNWSRVPGNDTETDSEKVIRFLVDVLDLDWAENATITKSVDELSINITDDGNTATITIDENKKTATVKVGDEIIYVLEVRIEEDTLNIYDCNLEKMEESVSGIGYVMLDKDLASGQMQVREHGSGLYSSDMVFESGRLDKVTEAEYQPTTFNFSDGFDVNFSSKWVQGICAKNIGESTAIHKKISDATSMKDDTTATKSSMEFKTAFNGSMHIGARTKGTRISEDYIGVFNITELIKIGKPAISTPSTPTPDWLPCPFPEPGVSTPPSDLECPSDP